MVLAAEFPANFHHEKAEWDGIKQLDDWGPIYRSSDLRPGIAYRFRVRGRNKVGWSPWSEVREAMTTLSAAPDTPEPPSSCRKKGAQEFGEVGGTGKVDGETKAKGLPFMGITSHSWAELVDSDLKRPTRNMLRD